MNAFKRTWKRVVIILTIAILLITLRHQAPELLIHTNNKPEESKSIARIRQLKLTSSHPSVDLQHKNAQKETNNANRFQQSLVQKESSRRFPTEPPIILVWKGAKYMMDDKEKHLEFTTETECGQCRVTTNRSFINKSIAVVLFNNRDLAYHMDVPDPRTRRLEQSYVFWSRETPAKLYHFKSALEDKRFDPLFNLTMTMFYKSDVRMYFGSFRGAVEISIKQNFIGNFETLMKPKRKVAVWFVSACSRLYGDVKRMEYAKSLQKAGLKLDKFGKCFHARAAKRLVTLVSEYKFYLAFENSIHCPNYVTEKFWRNSLEAGLVPIVWGPTRADVELVAPPDSFIFAEDFKTPKDLVKHINYLDKHDTEYLKYHQWRNTLLDTIPVHQSHYKGTEGDFCILCKRLLLEKHPPKSIPSISKWFYEGYPDDQCLQPPPILTAEEKRRLVDF